MSFETINPNRFDVDSPVSTDLFASIVNDLNFLNGVNTSAVDGAGAPLILNGSFESPLVASSTSPDNWTLVPGTGGTITTINTDQIHGAQSLKFTRDATVGHSGGTATSSAFFNTSPYLRYQIIFMMKCSGSGVSNSVVINWYAADQSALSSTTIYSSSTSPTAWTDFRYLVNPPATAMFGKIVLSGCTASTSGSASTLFDGLSFSPGPYFSEPVQYTSSTNLTCNIVGGYPGPWKVKMWGCKPSAAGITMFGGYCERVVWMRVGDTLAITISNVIAGTSTCVFSGRDGATTMTVTNAASNAQGTASGGNLNMSGGSSAPTCSVLVEYP